MDVLHSSAKVLCYGDSNTWGKIAGSNPAKRYSTNERWTGLLQQKLGTAYEVIEHGLNSRTTDLDDPDPQKAGRNGLSMLMPTLESQVPDTVIFMLGTNDLKAQYARSAEDVTAGMRRLLDEVTAYSQKSSSLHPTIYLLSPPVVLEEFAKDEYAGAEQKSRQLALLYQQLAEEYSKENEKCFFVNVAQYVEPSKIDGVHLDKVGHSRLAEVLYLTFTSKR